MTDQSTDQPRASDDVGDRVARIADQFLARAELLVAVESCTGGLIAAACTERSGSSAWFDRGLVTYSNAAKQDCVGVALETLDEHGAVSEPVVAEMLAGGLAVSRADWSVAVSGVAGPNGGTPDKPVGTVVIGWQQCGQRADAITYTFDGDRDAVRQASVVAALVGLDSRLAVAVD